VSLEGPYVGRGEIRARKAAVEVGCRRRSFDAEYEPVVLKIIAELPAPDHAATSVARHCIERRKKRGGAEISPAHAVHAVAGLAAEIEAGPARGHIGGRGNFHIGKIGGGSEFDRCSAHIDNDERSTDAEKYQSRSLVAPSYRVGKVIGNIGESAAPVRRLVGRVNKISMRPCLRRLQRTCSPDER
jgi:hypothetical protein